MTETSPPDAATRKLVLDGAKSFIVQAPAGSGKTSLLVARYLTLLAQANNPEEIVAITFTRKAAAEMRARIIDSLKNPLPTNSLALLALKQNETKNWHIIENPNRLRIQTIDSLCHYLINHTPLFATIDSQATVVENEDAKEYYLQAAQEVLANLDDPKYAKHLKPLLLYLDNNWELTLKLFIAMLGSREQWLPHLVGLKNSSELRQKMEAELSEIAQENIECCLDALPSSLYHKLVAILVALQKHQDASSPLQQIVIKNGTIIRELKSWRALAELLLTKEHSWRKVLTNKQGFITSKNSTPEQKILKSLKSELGELLNQFQDYEKLRYNLVNVLLAPPIAYSEQEWIIIEALLELLPLLAAHLQVIFQEHKVTDHIAISMAALQVFGAQDAPSNLALNLDYHLQHLLIDEFQDTALVHYRLIENLISSWQPGDGHTIFIVGDPMQSIYRFRNAEVGLFLRAKKEGIGGVKLEPVTLSTNFRTTKNIVTWLNNNFKKILPQQAEISWGAIPFNPSAAITTSIDSHVDITLLADGNDELEALEVITTIQKIVAAYPQDSIAILVKARTHLNKIIPALKKANLAYQAFELETLQDSMVIRDLFSLTRALYSLTDRIAWLAILRAPWCGLTLKDLHTVANGEHKLMWDNICNYQELPLSAAGRTRIIKLHAVLLQVLALRERLSWQELIKTAWMLLGGPATVTEKEALEDATIYLELLTTPLIISKLQKKLKLLFTPPKTVLAKIKLLTIHKAKGLEFDHVLIPGINRPTRFDDNQLLLWYERPKLHQGSNLLLAPLDSNSENSIYKYLKMIEHKKRFYEHGRLLYVALTRAKKTVTVIGNIKSSTTKPITAGIGTLLEQLQPCVELNWVKNLPSTEPAPLANNSASMLRLSDEWQLPIPISLPQGNIKPHFELVNNQAAILGTVIHYFLQKIAAEKLEAWLPDRIKQQEPYLRKLLLQEGFLDVSFGLEIVTKAIKNSLTDPKGRWILTHHNQAISEFEITVKNKEGFNNYIIDRTFIDEDGSRWIIDYKTTQPKNGENIQEFLANEATKYSSQLQQYAQAMRILDKTHPLRIGLYFPLFSGWQEINNYDDDQS
jgi:ATP-dependent helicase/nuclease subunit A